MKKLILIALVISSCSMPDIECQPDLPCTANDLQYVEYNPPTSSSPPPTYPSQPVISIVSQDSKLVVSWNACSNSNSYKLYISTDRVNYFASANISSPHNIVALANNTKYYVSVAAVNNAGETASVEMMAIPGVIDNMNGSISIIAQGLTWSKCSQKDAIGNDTYNISNNTCSNGIPKKLEYCQIKYECDNSIVLTGSGLNGIGISEVYNSCSGKGLGWRVPSADELFMLNTIYNSEMWPDIVNDNYYPNNGWNSPQPYGGYVSVNIIQGYFQPPSAPMLPYYVICVK